MSLSANLKKIVVSIFMLVFACVFFAACGENDNSIHVDDVVINHEEYKLVIGSTFQIEASVVPVEATNKNIIYRSADSGVATVDTNGVVRGVSAGTTQIFATSDDGKMEANCLVTVVPTKKTRDTLTNLRYDTAKQRVSWDATSEMVNGISPSYQVSITKSGEQRATEKTVLTNYFDNIGATGDIMPGNEYSIKVRVLGDEYYYNDSAYTSSYVFTILAAPSQSPTVVKDGDDLFLSVPAVQGQTMDKYELVIKKRVGKTTSEEDLSAAEQALFETEDYTANYPQAPGDGTKVRWLLPSALTDGQYTAKVRVLGDEQNRVFSSAYVTLGENYITKLRAPSNLALTTGTDGTTVSWDTVKDATNYVIVLVTNGQTYKSRLLNANQTSQVLGSQLFNTGTPLDISSLSSYYIYMQALGNNELYYLDSAVSANCATLTLATPTGLTLTKGESDKYTLTWNPVANAEGYVVTIRNETASTTYNISGTVAERIFSSSDFALNRNSVQVVATSRARNVSNSQPSSYLTVIKLSAPGLETNAGSISWAQVEGATGYELTITSLGEGGAVVERLITDDGSANYSFALGEDYVAGDYSVAITALGNSSNVITSTQSQAKQFTKLGSPTQFRIASQNGIDYLQWEEVSGATNYQIEISQDSSVLTQTFTTTGISYAVSNYMANLGYGDYNFRIRAYGSTSTLMGFLNSEYTDSITAFRLYEPTGLSIRNGIIVWNDLSTTLAAHAITPSMFTYELKIDNSKKTVSETSFDTNTIDLSAGSHSVSIRAVVAGNSVINGNTYLLSSALTSSVNMYKLAAPSTITLTSVGSLTWNTVSSSDGVEIGSYNVVFKYANGNTSSYAASSNECPKSVVADVPFAGRVEVRVIANGGSNYLSSRQSTLTTYSKLPTPTLLVSYGELKWTYVKNEGKEILNYKVYVREDGTDTASSYDITANSWDMGIIPGGKQYWVSLQACGTAGGRILNSEVSGERKVEKLPTPDATTIRATNDLDGVTWDRVTSSAYDITINYITTTSEVKTMANASIDDNSYIFPDDTMWPGGTYQIKLRTKAAAGSTYINSDYSSVATVTRLATPTGLSISNSTLTWNDVTNAFNYKAKVAYGSAQAKDISSLIVNNRITLNVDGAEELRHELATYVGSITLSIKAIASSAAGSFEGILLNSATSLTKTVERYVAPEVGITADNQITFTTQLASTNGNVLIFTPYAGGAATTVTLKASETIFDMNCSRTYDDDGTLTENTKYNVSVKALGDGQITLDSPESDIYANPIVKLSSPDYKVSAGGTRTAGNWRVENGVLVWDLIPGAKSYRVEGYDSDDNRYDSGNITPLAGAETASCLPSIPVTLGTITFTIVSNGGLGDDSVQYITSQPTVTETIHKLGTHDDLRVVDGEIEWGTRDLATGKRTVVSTTTISGTQYTILTKYVVSYGQGESANLGVDDRFLLSEHVNSMQQVQVAVQAIGTSNSENIDMRAVYLSSNSTSALTVTILDRPTEFKVLDGVLTWTDQNGNYQNFELILKGDTGVEDKVIRLNGTSTDLADAQYIGNRYAEAYIRHYGTQGDSMQNTINAYVNSPISEKITNLIKLPDITTYGINEDGEFTWALSAAYNTPAMQTGRTLSLTVNDSDPTVVSTNTYMLDTSNIDVTTFADFTITAFVEGSAETVVSGDNYLRSNSFSLTTYKFAPVSSIMSSNGLQIQWMISDYELTITDEEEGDKTVANNKYILEYQYCAFGDASFGSWQTVVIANEKSWGLTKLGQYKFRISVASMDMNVLRSAYVTYNSGGVFEFNKFEGGEGTPEDPFIISDTTTGGTGGYYEHTTAAEKLAYMFIISDKFFKLATDITLSDNPITYDISHARTFSYASTNMPYTSEDCADVAFTGGLDGAGHTISNYTIVLNDRTALFKTLLGDYRTYTDPISGDEVEYNAQTSTSAGVKFYGRSGIVMNLSLEVSTIEYDESQGVLLNDGIAFFSHYSYGGWFVNCNVSYSNDTQTRLNLTSTETLIGGIVCYMSSFEKDVSSPKYRDARIVGCRSQLGWTVMPQYSGSYVRMGGLVGQNEAGLILASESAGQMEATTVGGIVYYNKEKLIGDSTHYFGVVSGCENGATITGLPTPSDQGLVGGICARNESYVMFCKNRGILSAINYFKASNTNMQNVNVNIGGICGAVGSAQVNGYMFNCLSVGTISVSTTDDDYILTASSKVGGLFATNTTAGGTNIINCLFDKLQSEESTLTTNLAAGGKGETLIDYSGWNETQLKNANMVVVEADPTFDIEEQTVVECLNNTSNLSLNAIFNDTTKQNYMMGSQPSLFTHTDGNYPVLVRSPSFS